MDELSVTHEVVRKLVAALGKTNLSGSSPIAVDAFLADALGVSAVAGLSRLERLPADRANRSELAYKRLAVAISVVDTTAIKNTARVNLVAEAFGWKGDAFMHHLKTVAKKSDRHASSLDGLWPALSRLGMSDPTPWISSVRNECGVCLVVGATGSGKTTTLELTVARLEAVGRPVIRIHDDHISERSRSGLRCLANSPPRIVYVEEVRSADDLKLLFDVSKRHLVVTSLFAGTVKGALSRVADLGCGDRLGLVRGVVAQSLIRTVCDQCREHRAPVCLGDCTARKRTMLSETVCLKSDAQIAEIMDQNQQYDGLIRDLRHKVLVEGVVSPEQADDEFGSLWKEQRSSRDIDRRSL